MNDDLDLGPCCVCEGTENVHHILSLNRRLNKDMLGHNLGWGCVTCGLAFDGAVAVVCDGCLDTGTGAVRGEIQFIRLGGHMAGRRVTIASIPDIPYQHDLSRHPEIWPAHNPLAPMVWFADSPDPGPDCLCSWCGQPILADDAPIRLWAHSRQQECRLHPDCLDLASTKGIL